MLRAAPDQSYVQGAPPPIPAGGYISWWQYQDTAQYRSLNGDLGSSHNPGSPIQIGGAGMQFAGSTLALTATSRLATAFGVPVLHGDNDWIVLGAGLIRFVLQALSGAIDTSYAVGANHPLFVFLNSRDGMYNFGGNTGYTGGARFICPLDVHNGGTLTQVGIYFAVGHSHANIPLSLPLFRVFAVDASGNVTNFYTPAVVGWAGNGFVQLGSPASGAAWYMGGGVQSAGQPFPGQVIDTSKYSYFVEVIDEAGPNNGSNNCYAGNTYISLQSTYSIADLRPQ